MDRTDYPCRRLTNQCGYDGSCMRCFADQGDARCATRNETPNERRSIMPKKKSYDLKCLELAEYFTQGFDFALSPGEIEEFAQAIQDACEGELQALEGRFNRNVARNLSDPDLVYHHGVGSEL